MIIKNNKNITKIFRGNNSITSVYKNQKIVFQEKTMKKPLFNYNFADYENNVLPTSLDSTWQQNITLANQLDKKYNSKGQAYVTITKSNGSYSYNFGSSSENIFNITPENANLTFICKAKTRVQYDRHFWGNRSNISTYNSMFRVDTNKISLHLAGENILYFTPDDEAHIFLFQIRNNNQIYLKDVTTNEETVIDNIIFSSNPDSSKISFFIGDTREVYNGDVYWLYYIRETLSEKEIKDVIDFNENYKLKPTNDLLLNFKTTYDGQNIKITNIQQYFDKITIVNSGDIITPSETGPYYYTFPTAGNYEIKFQLKDNLTDISEAFYFCNNLTELKSNLANNNNITYASGMFENCTSLTTIPDNLFNNCTNLLGISNLFKSCTSLTTMPDNLFTNCTKLINANGVFKWCIELNNISENIFKGCTSLEKIDEGFRELKITTIPENLFSDCTNLDTAQSCFEDCYNLTDIPGNLLSTLNNIRYIGNMFKDCTSLTTIPNNLLDNYQEDYIGGLFEGCTSLTTIPDNLFYNANHIGSFRNVFKGCTSLTTIPDNLFIAKEYSGNKLSLALVSTFENCTSLTTIPESLFSDKKRRSGLNLDSTFKGCTSLTTIPDNLFSYLSIYSADYTFQNCINLKSIPNEMFNKFYPSSSGNLIGTFKGCTSLTTIPDNLGKTTNLTNVSELFEGCTSLTTVPESLFTSNANLNTISKVFKDCTALENIPNNLFASNTNLTNVSGLFEGCTSLTTVPENLFVSNTNLTDISYIFNGCTSLTTIPDNLFDTCANIENVSYGFKYCTSLQNIPKKLFAFCSNILNFKELFNNCNQLLNVPLDKDDTPIYERSNGIDGYIKPENTLDCFKNCNSLPNFNDIPEEWGGPYAPKTHKVLTFEMSEGDQSIIITNKQEYFTEIKNMRTGEIIPNNSSGRLTYDISEPGLYEIGFIWRNDLTSIDNAFDASISSYTKLIKISPDFFSFEGAENITSMGDCFGNQAGITELPEGLLDPLINIENVGGLIWTNDSNPKLTTIPQYLFAKNKKINIIQGCFSRQRNLVSSCPIDEDGTPIYNRSNGKEGYTIPYDTNGCFSECPSMLYYNRIPQSWGGPYVPKEYKTITFNTTSENEKVRLTYKKEYFDLIVILETNEELDLNGEGELMYIFPNIGSHKVGVKIKDDVTTLSQCFYICSNLTSVPNDLFSNCFNVTDCSAVFRACIELTTLPIGLFDTFSNVITFEHSFDNCLSFITIPEGLFDNCTKIENLSYCFDGCSTLRTIPEKLFANNKQVTNFSCCFQFCTHLSNIPIDEDGTPIYNRSNGKDGYIIPTNVAKCFYGCNELPNIYKIPVEWELY